MHSLLQPTGKALHWEFQSSHDEEATGQRFPWSETPRETAQLSMPTSTLENQKPPLVPMSRDPPTHETGTV